MHLPLLLQCFHVFSISLPACLASPLREQVNPASIREQHIHSYIQPAPAQWMKIKQMKSWRWDQIHKLPFHSLALWVCLCLCWIEESQWVLLEDCAWWAVGRVCNVVKLPSAMIRHPHRCAAEVPKLNRSEASVRKGRRRQQRQHFRWSLLMCHQKSLCWWHQSDRADLRDSAKPFWIGW